MSPQEIPSTPNIEQCRKQAKDLLKAHRLSDISAIKRIREHHPRLSKMTDAQIGTHPFSLADAQCVIAREHGISSWPHLKKHIERTLSELESRRKSNVAPPDTAPSDGAVLRGATPIFQVTNLADALEWYQKVLGFKVAWTWGDPADRASVCRDNAELNLAVPAAGPFTISRVYFEIADVNAYHSRVHAAGGNIIVPIADRPYGMRDFRVLDPSGNELSFGESTSVCESCGMPMAAQADHGGGDITNTWCLHCCHPDGRHFTFDEKLASTVKWLLSDSCAKAGFPKATSNIEAQARARTILLERPYWKRHKTA